MLLRGELLDFALAVEEETPLLWAIATPFHKSAKATQPIEHLRNIMPRLSIRLGPQRTVLSFVVGG
jgi:hypothetical protein